MPIVRILISNSCDDIFCPNLDVSSVIRVVFCLSDNAAAIRVCDTATLALTMSFTLILPGTLSTLCPHSAATVIMTWPMFWAGTFKLCKSHTVRGSNSVGLYQITPIHSCLATTAANMNYFLPSIIFIFSFSRFISELTGSFCSDSADNISTCFLHDFSSLLDSTSWWLRREFLVFCFMYKNWMWSIFSLLIWH